MDTPLTSFAPECARFEVLPLGRSEEQAAQLPEPLRLTVTCSPKHGPDESAEVAARLHALGHAVTVHVAARMIRDRAHLDALMASMVAAGVDDLFVIGGDADPPQGAYASAVELAPLIAEHPQRPRAIGIAGYPEGHPKISDQTLDDALSEKSQYADYITTQMCFDPKALRAWAARQRQRGVAIPVLVGMPGQVARTRLLEMSVRIGVGSSLTFLKKQRGIRSLFSKSTADKLYDEFAPDLNDPQLNIAGFHYFTFNQLIDTYNWHEKKLGASADAAGRKDPSATRCYVPREETTT
jgi:methylenetetrahydrofolate reductase (NADPH)